MILLSLSRSRNRCRIGHSGAHGFPVAELFVIKTRGKDGNPCCVIKGVAKRNAALAMGRELRPDLGDWRVVSDQASLNHQVRQRRRHALGRRENWEERALPHRVSTRSGHSTGSGIDNETAIPINGNLNAVLFSLRDKAVEKSLKLVLQIE